MYIFQVSLMLIRRRLKSAVVCTKQLGIADIKMGVALN